MCLVKRSYHPIYHKEDDYSQDHERLLKRTIQLAYDAKRAGNPGFGAILVNASGEIMVEAQNEVNTSSDCTAHAELRLIQKARAHYEPDALKEMTLYSNCEPCVMCMGAIIWSGIGQIVFGTSESKMLDMSNATVEFNIPAKSFTTSAELSPTMIGPFEQLDEFSRILFK